MSVIRHTIGVFRKITFYLLFTSWNDLKFYKRFSNLVCYPFFIFWKYQSFQTKQSSIEWNICFTNKKSKKTQVECRPAECRHTLQLYQIIQSATLHSSSLITATVHYKVYWHHWVETWISWKETSASFYFRGAAGAVIPPDWSGKGRPCPQGSLTCCCAAVFFNPIFMICSALGSRLISSLTVCGRKEDVLFMFSWLSSFQDCQVTF